MKKNSLCKKLLVLVFLCISGITYAEKNAEYEYIGAGNFTLTGKAMPSDGPLYHRIDTMKYNDIPALVKRFLVYPTGLAVCFKTNSPSIVAKWVTTKEKLSSNLTPIVNAGLDLYIKKNGKWVWAGVGRPTVGSTEHQYTLVEDMDNSEKDCILYLPVFDEIKELNLGFVKGSVSREIPDPFRKEVVIYGSSIVHGIGASRSGLLYPAQMSRNTGINFVNLGINGNAKMEPSVAEMFKDINADAFILDCMPNPSPEQITDRTQHFVKTIRKYHPKVPIIMIEAYMRENANFNRGIYEHCVRQGIAFEEQYNILKKNGMQDIYYIKDNHALGVDHEGSGDGVHPNDVGFGNMVRQYQPQIMKILEKYGIR